MMRNRNAGKSSEMQAATMTRRRFLAALGGLTATLAIGPRVASASTASSPRMLVVLLRGAMDGLHLLPPRGDPHLATARGVLAVEGARSLDGSFGLHPGLPFAHALFARKQLLPVLAVAPPYRQRSHFDAQDCLENGTAVPGGRRDGWIGRCIEAMSGTQGLAIAQVMPLAMRGSTRSDIWSPPLPRDPSEMLMGQLQALYAEDARLAPAFADAMRAGDLATTRAGAFRLEDAMAVAARRLKGNDGARIAFVEDTGWDTHRGQEAALARKFGELDAGLRGLHDGLGEDWRSTVVMVVTEFGRTVRANGSGGTDHGVGGVALLAGGAVRGGRVVGDWPGLAPADLLGGRDLRATTDLRALFKGVLLGHLGLRESVVETMVFPDSRDVRPFGGLV